ncbi:MAG: amidohydrolase family protein [Geminicoccaceae bacterium]
MISVVDSHLHVWDPAQFTYPWHTKVQALAKPMALADFDRAMGHHSAEQMVFVEADVAPGQHIDEALWVDKLGREDPRIAAIVAHAPIDKGEEVEGDLQALAAIDRVRGVRRLLQHENDPAFCLRPTFIAGVRLLPKYNLSFDICIFANQFEGAIEMVRRCSEVTFILDHLGKPFVRDDVMQPWAAQIERLASFDNIVCKLSGLATEADHAHWTEDQLRRYSDHILACFGPERILYGGDWPVSTLATTLPRWLGLVEATIAQLSSDEQALVLRDNARRVYRISQ